MAKWESNKRFNFGHTLYQNSIGLCLFSTCCLLERYHMVSFNLMKEQGFRPEQGKQQHPSREVQRRVVPCDETKKVVYEKVIAEQPPRESARKKGELEKADANIEPLPPTPITDEAKSRLLSWGATEDEIEILREITSSLHYGHCDKKAERLLKEPAYIYETDEGTEEVVIPNYFDSSDRGDGQCRDNAVQWIRLYNRTEAIEDLDENVEDSVILDPVYMWGKSRTHFNKEESTHVWAGLLKRGDHIENAVIIDPSFQEMMTVEESGYEFDENSVIIKPDTLTDYQRSHAIPVGEYIEEENGTWSTYAYGDGILGSSNDRKFSYFFTFLKDTETGQIKPLVQAQNAEGIGIKSLTYGRDDYMRISGEDESFTTDHLIELSAVLYYLKKISLVRDQDEAIAAKNDIITVSMYDDWENA